MNEKRNVKLRDALLRALAVATFTAVSATAFTPVAQARVLLDDVNNDVCDLGNDDTGDGTAADPFRISTVEDLAEIGDCDKDGDYFYSLENDLDISPDDNFNNDNVDWNTTDGGWEPIGEFHGITFSGEFDGNGHTISGLEIDNNVRMDDYVGLFSEMDDAVIKDLTIVGEIDADDYEWVGILAGSAEDSQISNVHIDADIYDADDYVGALLGEADGTRMSNITTTGDVVSGDEDDYIGGIVGLAESEDGSYEPSIIDSSSDVNINDVNETSNENSEVGGIVGAAEYLRVLRVSFDGTVTGDEQVGGIAGSFYEGLIHDSVVTEDALINVPVDEYAYDIGGLVGELDYSTISGSSFHGTLDAYLDTNDIDDVGGIVGDSDSSYIVNVHVSSTALLELAGNGDASDSIGGIAGYIDETAISGATMDADLTVLNASEVGGLVGAMYDSQLDSSVNRGDVTVTLDAESFLDDEAAVGGLVGDAYDGASVTNSTNKGDVTQDGDENNYGVGGIVGIGDEVVITDNYNTGDVSGEDNVAGVVGMLTTQGAVVQRNFSLGTLTGYDMDPDGIATLESQEVALILSPAAIGEDLYFDEPSNVVLLSDRADNVTGAQEWTAAKLKTASLLTGLGWLVGDVDRADWAISSDFNDGFPHLAWENVSDDIDENVGLEDATFDQIVTFPGAKRWKLRTFERNALNVVADLANTEAYDNLEVHVYYSAKAKLAQKRGLSVKRWLVRQGVAQTITVYIHLTDNSNPVGSVTIEALVD